MDAKFFYPVIKQERAQFFTVKGRERCKFPAFDACSVANIPRGVLSTRVHPDTRIRIEFVWTGKFDLNMDTCERGNFLTRKEQVADSKISGYVWRGLKFIHYEFFLQRRVVQSWVKITQG